MRSYRGQRRTGSGTKQNPFPSSLGLGPAVARACAEGGAELSLGHLSVIPDLQHSSGAQLGRRKSALSFFLKDVGVLGWCSFRTQHPRRARLQVSDPAGWGAPLALVRLAGSLVRFSWSGSGAAASPSAAGKEGGARGLDPPRGLQAGTGAVQSMPHCALAPPWQSRGVSQAGR